MASGNDSQGLKIAVAIFVSLTVILAVATYFMYSEYAKSSELLVAAKNEVSQKTQAASQALTDFRNLRDRAGYRDKSDPKAIMDEIGKDQTKLLEKLETAAQEMEQVISKAQEAGASAEEIQTFRGNLAQIRQRLADESSQDPTLRSTIDTLADIAENQARLTTALAVDNLNLRGRLASVDSVNKSQLDVQSGAAKKAFDDLQGQVAKYEQIRQDQMVQIDQLQTERAELIAKVDQLDSLLKQQEDQFKMERSSLLAQLQSWRTQAEQRETVMDTRDGLITYVDEGQRQVITNVTRSMGAKPQMILSVFERDATGLPTDKPKARVKLIQVGDRQSIASIEEQFDPRNPLRPGDQLYSAAWSPSEPQRFALIGRIDMDRDGRDDRKDLIALIQAAGGIVEYDLPPPGEGQERGELTAQSAWYVVDDRPPIRRPNEGAEEKGPADELATFNRKKTDAIDKARELGVRPMPIARLLSSLGYSYGMTIPGNVEAKNKRAIEEILNPGGRRGTIVAPDGAVGNPQP